VDGQATAAALAAVAAGAVADRRVCTVLFCDPVRFTPMAESIKIEAC